MIRIAAVGDVHVDQDVVGRFRPALNELPDCADVLLLAGDLTRHGTEAEARCVAEEFGGLGVPVVTVLGNHDHQHDRVPQVVKVLQDAGIRVLEGEGIVLEFAGGRLGVAGVKGFGGGFAGRCASDFGEPEMKSFVRTTKESAEALGVALRGLDCDLLVALTHYSPCRTPWPASRWRSTRSSARTSSGRPSTRRRPRWRCTGTRTPAASGAPPRAGSGSATSPTR